MAGGQPGGAAGVAARSLGVAALLGLAAWRLYGTPPLLLAAALLPALAYAAAMLWLAGSPRPPLPLLAAMGLWGAGAAALLSAAANDAAQVWLGALHDAERARRLAPWLAAPAIEEIIKALPLAGVLILHRAGGGRRDAVPFPVRDGILYGACIGLGFTVTENAHYFLLAAVQGGEAGLWQSVYLRGGLGGLTHAVFTGSVGAALGWAAQQHAALPRLAALAALGLAVAVAEHTVWNAVAADAIDALVCNPVALGGACRSPAPPSSLFAVAPLLVAASLGPPLAGLIVIARLSASTETS